MVYAKVETFFIVIFVTIVDWLPTSAHFKGLDCPSAHLKPLKSRIDRRNCPHSQPRKTSSNHQLTTISSRLAQRNR